MNKFFNGKKYSLDLKNNRWHRTTDNGIPLSHDVWNYYYPNDPILKDELIHHINRDKSDNRIENLQKMKRSDHVSLHHSGTHPTDEAKQKMSDSQLGHTVTDKTKQKIHDANLGNKNQNWKKRRSNNS